MTIAQPIEDTSIRAELRLLCVELTSTCNPACVHCYAESGLQVRDHNHLVANGTSLVLAVGDAVVFDATRLDHHTTPLVATDEDAEPQGMVLVGPYFLRGSGPARN
jgi:hypothetical protein